MIFENCLTLLFEYYLSFGLYVAYGIDEGCVIPNHILTFVVRLVLFNAPLWYTHVFNPSSDEYATSAVSTKDERIFSLQMSRVHADSENCAWADNTGASDLLREFDDRAANGSLKEIPDSTTSCDDSKTISDACSLTEITGTGD